MSGIYGIINLKNNPVDPSQMNKMEELLIHRGVDGKAQWIDGHVGLGHLKLEITPESEYERLPLEYKQWVITADARIDNRDELDISLNVLEEERAFTPDTTYIVKAYEKWGKDCVKHLIGDFAFAIWDKVEKTLFCARDHIGIKPFFYLKTEDKFIFSSELKTIVELREIPVELNESKLGDWMYFMIDMNNPSDNLFKGIQRLLPAHSCWLVEQKFSLNRYWQLEYRKEINLENDDAYISKMRELIFQAVECRMRTNYTVGVTLSGGLDSSSITCIAARKLAREGKKLYSASSVLSENWKGIEEDERNYIETVLEQEKNIVPSFVTTEQFIFFNDIKEVLNRTYFPVNAFYNMDNALANVLKEKGNIRIILSGFTGDMSVSQKANTLVPCLIKRLELKKAVHIIQLRSKIENISFLKLFIKECILPFTPKYLKNLYKKVTGNFRKSDSFEEFINERFNEKHLLTKKYKTFFVNKLLKHDIHNQIVFAFNSCTTYIQEVNIQKSHFGTEEVFPFADIRLLNFLINIPISYFQLNGWKRGMIRHSMESVLPKLVQWRPDKCAYIADYNRNIIKNKNNINNILSSEEVSTYFNIQHFNKTLEHGKIYKNWYDLKFSDQLIILGHELIIMHYLKFFSQKNNSINLN